MRRRKKFLTVLFFFLFLYMIPFLAVAQKQEKIYSRDSEQCKKVFDIDEVNIRDGRFIRYIPLLAEYFQCHAAVNNDISECEQLAPWEDRVSTCQHYFFDMYGFFAKIFIEKEVSEEALSICVKNFRLQKEQCQAFAEACYKNDKTFCRVFQDSKLARECEAYVTMDETLCQNNSSCRNRVIFLRAIKAKNIQMCNGIKDPMAKAMCRGYVSGNERVCYECEGYDKFKEEYCNARKSMEKKMTLEHSADAQSKGGNFEEF